jgi:ribosomal protein S18 acetylase RimI-like enzyme
MCSGGRREPLSQRQEGRPGQTRGGGAAALPRNSHGHCAFKLRRSSHVVDGSGTQGWPSPDPTQPVEVSFAHLRIHFTTITQPTRFFIMKLHEAYVGYAGVHDGPMTAVHPAYRNRGIAKVLKAHAIHTEHSGGSGTLCHL